MPSWNFDVFEGDPPQPGWVMVGTRNRYVVTGARPVESRQWHDRWRLTLRKLGPDEPNPPGARVQEYSSYAPGDCANCIAREAGIEVPADNVCGAGCWASGPRS